MPSTTRTQRNPADGVLRARLKEELRFPDLTERRALKLSAVLHYTSRAHFGLWHRRMGGPDFNAHTGIFTPLFLVEIETTDVSLNPLAALQVRGETYLAKTLDPAGEVDHIIREGRHTLLSRGRQQYDRRPRALDQCLHTLRRGPGAPSGDHAASGNGAGAGALTGGQLAEHRRLHSCGAQARLR